MTTAYWAHDRTTHTISISPTVIHGDDEGTFDTTAAISSDTEWKANISAADYAAVTTFAILSDITVSTMRYWCASMSSLTSVTGLEYLHHESGAGCYGMFQYCTSAVILDLTGFDTAGCGNMAAMFNGCTSLKTLILTDFDVSSANVLAGFVFECGNLETIYVTPEKWGTPSASVQNDYRVFDTYHIPLSNLTGGNGTHWDSGNTLGLYARIDAPGTPGYLTDINDIESPSVLITAPSETEFLVEASVTFTCDASGASIGAPSWDFGDGTTGTGTSAAHTYNSLGEKTVTVTVTSPYGVATDTITITIVPPLDLTIVTPENNSAETINTDVRYEARSQRASSIVWTFDDSTTQNGAVATKKYTTCGTHTASVTATSDTSETVTQTVTINIRKRGYEWESSDGTITTLNTISTRVVRSGISGFAQNCVELSTSSNSNNYGEWVTQQKITRRECSFRIVIKAENHAALEQSRQQFLSAFNCINGKTGKLHHYTDAGLHRYLNVDDVRVNIRDGLAKGTLAQYQYIDLTFVAADPFFYGDEITVTSFASAVNNPGDVITPVEITASADTITNTVGTAARSITGTNLTGTVINVTDNSLTAELSGANVINRFNMNSHFWMIQPGNNTIAGASRIVFRPRWSAI